MKKQFYQNDNLLFFNDLFNCEIKKSRIIFLPIKQSNYINHYQSLGRVERVSKKDIIITNIVDNYKYEI